MRHIVRVTYVKDPRTFSVERAISQGVANPTKGYTFIWPDRQVPPLGTLAYDHRGAAVCVVGYDTAYDGPLATLVPVRTAPTVSVPKVVAAVLTCGLSLPFTRGIRTR